MSISEKKSKNKIIIAIMLGTLAGIGPLCIDLYLPALPQIAEVFHANTSQTQLSLTAVLLGLAFGQILVGGYSDVFGRKKPLFLSLLLFTVSTFICAFSPSITILIAARFMQGVFGSGGMVLSRAIAKDLYSGVELTKFFALLMLINGLAPVLSPLVGGQLIKFTDWSGIFILLGIFSIFMLAASMIILDESLPKEKRSDGGIKNILSSFGKLVKNKVFMGYMFSVGFIFAGIFAYISGSPFALQNIYGLSPETFSLCFAVNGLGMIAGATTTGKLVSKYSESKLLASGLILSVIASTLLMAAILLKLPVGFIVASMFLFIFSVGMIETTCSSLAMGSLKENIGSASALLGLTIFTLGALASPIAGLGGKDSAVPMAAVIMTCCILSLISALKTSQLRKKSLLIYCLIKNF